MQKHPCTQVMSLALVTTQDALHQRCGAPMTAHYGQDALGTVYAPTTNGGSK